MERTFVMLKPETIKRRLIGEIITRFERKGFYIAALKLIKPTTDILEKHYAEHKERPFYSKLISHISSGNVVAMVIEGKECVSAVRKLVGETNPNSSTPGSIRFDYGNDLGRNIVHASDSVESGKREIAIWFDTVDQTDLFDLNLINE